ncbi:four helix bundle protein [uncultured Draconibacterium sp.]|uniref:four helix bundle protein n=1 Tax=uncultured Draconibacterium sp. TaxID=1573823 RepID=UPI0032166506
MDSNSWIDYKIQVRERLKVFALNILELSNSLPNSERAHILNRQITRSGTSTYANYRAALRARSKAEFFAKLSVTVEEADETEMWLDLIIDSKISVSELAIQLHAESVEIIKILATMRKRLK